MAANWIMTLGAIGHGRSGNISLPPIVSSLLWSLLLRSIRCKWGCKVAQNFRVSFWWVFDDVYIFLQCNNYISSYICRQSKAIRFWFRIEICSFSTSAFAMPVFMNTFCFVKQFFNRFNPHKINYNFHQIYFYNNFPLHTLSLLQEYS